MADKITPKVLTSGFASIAPLNENFSNIATELNDKVLYRNTSEPNQMETTLDMNSNKLINLTAPQNNTDAARLQDVLEGVVTTATILPSPTSAAGKYLGASGGSFVFQDSSKLDWTQVGTGATLRSVDIKLKENSSIKDFGAIGNGVADDTTAIQNTFNLGGVIFIPAGTYLIDPLTVPSNTHLVFEPGAIFKLNNSQDDHMLTNSDSIGGNTNIHIHSGEFNGNKANQTTFVDATGILLDNVTNSTVSNTYVHDTEFTGIEFRNCNNVIMFNPLSEDCGTANVLNSGDGLGIRSSIDCHIIAPTVRRASRIGILYKGTITSPCIDCTCTGPIVVEDTGEDALHAEDFAQNITFSNFLIKTTGLNTAGATKSAVAIGDAGTFGITLKDGEIRDAGAFGIEIAGGVPDVILDGIKIINPTSDVIRVNISDGTGAGLGGMRGLRINNVHGSSGGRDGISIGRSPVNGIDPLNLNEGIVITNCSMTNMDRVGYSFLSCPDIKVINCDVDGIGLVTVADAVEFLDCDRATIKGGLLNGYPRTGIKLTPSLQTTMTEVEVSDVTFDGDDIGIHGIAITNSNFLRNTIRDLTGVGSIGIVMQTTSTGNTVAYNVFDKADTPFNLVGTNKTVANIPAKQQFTITNDVTDRTFDANTVLIAELADVVATLIKDGGAA